MSGKGCNCGESCFCGGTMPEGLAPREGDPGLVYGADSRVPWRQMVRARGGAVLGPTLGGGFSGSHIGSGLGRIGGGLRPAVTHALGPDPVVYPESVRTDFRFDYSTPRRIFERDIQHDPALNRELGGLHGGSVW